MPFIDEILNNINTIICDLQPQQVSEPMGGGGFLRVCYAVSRLGGPDTRPSLAVSKERRCVCFVKII